MVQRVGYCLGSVLRAFIHSCTLRQRHKGGEGTGKLPLLTSQAAVNSTAGHRRLGRETQKERVGREGGWQGEWGGG